MKGLWKIHAFSWIMCPHSFIFFLKDGNTYIRWGRSDCPAVNGTSLVYSGKYMYYSCLILSCMWIIFESPKTNLYCLQSIYIHSYTSLEKYYQLGTRIENCDPPPPLFFFPQNINTYKFVCIFEIRNFY